MSFIDDIKVVSNSFKRYHSDAHIGHFITEMGSVEDGVYTETLDTLYDSDLDEYAPCILVYTTMSPTRSIEVTLTFVVKTCKIQMDDDGNEIYESSTQFNSTIKRPLYEHDSTETYTITISAWEQAGVSYKIGDSSNIYEIVSVTSNYSLSGIGSGVVHAIASIGSKVMYSLSFKRAMNDATRIAESMFIGPPECPTCDGTGLVGSETCPQCNGFLYSGKGAIDYLLKRHAKEIGIGPTSGASDEHYQHKLWAYKWWNTPTKTEIIRMFAFFANIPVSTVEITERYSEQEPAWYLALPAEFGEGSQFESSNTDDLKFLRMLLDSVTPAGTVGYLTYYSNAFDTEEWFFNDDYDFAFRFASAGSLTPKWGTTWDDLMFNLSGYSTSGYMETVSGYVSGFFPLGG